MRLHTGLMFSLTPINFNKQQSGLLNIIFTFLLISAIIFKSHEAYLLSGVVMGSLVFHCAIVASDLESVLHM